MTIYHLINGLLCFVSLSLAATVQFDALKIEGFDGVAFTNYLLDQQNSDSVIQCTMLCLWNIECMSFVFAAGTGFCSLHKTVFASFENSYSYTAARYYVAGRKELCPIDKYFIHFRTTNTCHRLVTNMTVLFPEAEATCISFGGHLSKFDSDAERQAIIDLKYASTGYNGAYMTGAYRDGPGSSWVWRDGTNARILAYWRTGEPSGSGACAYMCANNPACQFNDAPCNAWRFMCEIDI